MGKTPLLPRYKLWIYVDETTKVNDNLRGVGIPPGLLIVPQYQDFWSFQMEMVLDGQPKKLTEDELTRQAILYLYEHRHDLINPTLYERMFDKKTKQEVPASWDREKDLALKGILEDVDLLKQEMTDATKEEVK